MGISFDSQFNPYMISTLGPVTCSDGTVFNPTPEAIGNSGVQQVSVAFGVTAVQLVYYEGYPLAALRFDTPAGSGFWVGAVDPAAIPYDPPHIANQQKSGLPS